jgi:phosphate-selective porin OprO/OprP
MRQKMVPVAALMAVMLLLVFGGISRADRSAKLINLLIKKGIITREEAKELEEELQEEEKQQQVAAPAKAKQEAAQLQKAEVREEKTAEWTKKVEIGYKEGAYIKTADDNFSIKFNFGLEPLFIYNSKEEAEDSTTFKLRRARLWISGNAFYPWLKYLTQITLEGGDTYIRDAYIQAAYLDWFQPRLGEFKVPYDREFLIAGFGLEFIERSIASETFSLYRDLGADFSGQLLCNHLTYAVGVFNGGGVNQANEDNDYMYVGRVVWMPFDKVGYTQAAVDTPKKPRLAIGVGAAYMPGLEPGERKIQAGKLGDTKIVPVESDVVQAVADISFAYKRLYLEGGYYFRNIDPKEATPHGSQDAYGLYFQTGYFLIPEHFELAARYSFIDPDNPVKVSDNKEHEGTFGVNYYFCGHRLKAQANYTLLNSESETGARNDHIFQSAMCLLY